MNPTNVRKELEQNVIEYDMADETLVQVTLAIDEIKEGIEATPVYQQIIKSGGKKSYVLTSRSEDLQVAIDNTATQRSRKSIIDSLLQSYKGLIRQAKDYGIAYSNPEAEKGLAPINRRTAFFNIANRMNDILARDEKMNLSELKKVNNEKMRQLVESSGNDMRESLYKLAQSNGNIEEVFKNEVVESWIWLRTNLGKAKAIQVPSLSEITIGS